MHRQADRREEGRDPVARVRAAATQLRIASVATLSLAVLFCGIYPLLVWLAAQGLFPEKANGSLLVRDGRIIGSTLIGQSFTGPGYFHPRPSAAGEGYDAANSGGSNRGPTSGKLMDLMEQRVVRFRMENDLSMEVPVPADAVTASASGLDPHISLPNALLQSGRVAKARGIPERELVRIVKQNLEGRDLGCLGEPRVNVLKLNLLLDENRPGGKP